MIIAAQSGKGKTSLSAPPLRTVRDSFPSYGSSLSKPIAAAMNRLEGIELVESPVTIWVDKVVQA